MMFQTSAKVPVHERTVGVVARVDDQIAPGYNMMSVGRETYLFDSDGRVVHEWMSSRIVFCTYLLPNGNLLRDGSENIIAVGFRTGGAAGFVEEVTWDGQRVWAFQLNPVHSYLSHHDLQPLPNGNVLMMTWARKTKAEAIAAGRRPELIPDDEVWDNVILELKPNGKGGADVVWQWCFWDHLIQDYDPLKANFGEVSAHPERFDINACPPMGKAGARNMAHLKPGGAPLESHANAPPKTGERDWLHVNSLSYDSVRDQIVLSCNVHSEIVIIDHSTSMEESTGSSGGRCGRGGDIIFRWGNPMNYRRGDRRCQQLFCQHSVSFLRGVPGDGHVLLFNNGRAPDRHWSTVDEIELPEPIPNSGSYIFPSDNEVFGPAKACWSYGPSCGKRNSFYSTHISSCQRLRNGNTLITQGPEGIVFEVTPGGEEVWRYINPVVGHSEGDSCASCFLRQGDTDISSIGRRSLFNVSRYDPSYSAFEGRDLKPTRFLEA